MAGFKSLSELRDERRRYVEAARNNGFEEGLRSLLADLYPDNAHFIYELLQNAEDAGASSVTFELQHDRLVVSHDGKRQFTIEDINAITGIGQSVKRDDPTRIGKFGVGFKAVFAYTDHPEVHSGEHSFVITDLFVPEVTSGRHRPGETVFVFPFDRKEKSADRAYNEIARGLKDLGSSTLLFLSRISAVQYRLADGQTGSVTRDDTAAPTITITETKDSAVKASSWLRLVGQPAGFPNHLSVAAAFSLHDPVAKADRKRAASRLRIQPIEDADTCIYFPAAKERSGLRFHIHAPFASTVARDSVRDDEENDHLVEAIGQLVVDALPRLRDDGLLDDGLLAALPNADDVLPGTYEVIRTLITEAFNGLPLTPVFGGGSFAPARELFQSPAEFRTGLDHEDLDSLLAMTWHPPTFRPEWMAPRTGKAGQFLKGLDAGEFGWEELTEVLSNVESDYLEERDSETDGPKGGTDDTTDLSLWRQWISTKSDDRLRALYEMLGHGWLEDDLSEQVDLPLIRLTKDNEVVHVDHRGIYLPADPNDLGPDRIPPAFAYFDDDEPTKTKNSLEAFYKWFEVHRWDDRAAVRQRLDVYRAGDKPSGEQHIQDLRMFIEYLDVRPRETTLFHGVSFLRGVDSDGKAWWRPPIGLVIDAPYTSTGLALLPQFRYRLCPSYLDAVENIADFARILGATSELALKNSRPQDNPAFERSWEWNHRVTQQGTRQDWDLAEFDAIVGADDPTLLRALWDFACKSPGTKALATYQANGSSTPHRFKSRIAHRLSTSAWILDRHGNLRTPQSMVDEDLPTGWPSPPTGSLAASVGFGEQVRAADLAERVRRDKASSLGISIEIVDEFASLDDDARVEALAFLRELKERAAFPEAASANPERRSKLIAEDAAEAPLHRTEKRERSVTVGAASETKSLAGQFLREQYGRGGRVHCQACHQPSEFKVSDEWYFEKVEFVGGRKQLHRQNYLALCPLCAAKYKYVRQPDDERLLSALADLEVPAGAGTVSLAITLNGKSIELKFTGKHAVDLKAVLDSAGEARTSD